MPCSVEAMIPDRTGSGSAGFSAKTTEFYAMVAVIAGILVAAWYVGRDSVTDAFTAERAWLYVAIVASAYMISRGLAKSGTRERTDDDD